MKKIFEQYMKKESLDKFQEKLKEDKDFKINKSNIQNFFECEDVQKILKDNNIEYEAKLEEIWKGKGRYSKYHIQLNIFIKEKDYEKIKEYFELQNTVQEEKEEKYLPAKVVEYIKEGFYVIISLLIIGIGIAFFIKNMDSLIANIENIISAILITTMGFIILLCRIIKYITRRKNR